MTAPNGRGKTRKALTWLTALAAAAALTLAGIALRPWTLLHDGPVAAGRTAATDVSTLRTQEVTRGSLVAETRLNGRLSYDEPSDLAPATGMITRLPDPGARIDLGEQVYENDGTPVPLFQGDRPFWRTIDADATDGPDIRQLEDNLKGLGYFAATPDSHYDLRTSGAVKAWQRKALGRPAALADGIFRPGSVVLVASAPIRITMLKAKTGDVNVSPASYTGTALHASATISATQAATFKPGDRATLTLPDNATLDVALAAVDPGGQPTADGQTAQPSVRIDFTDQMQVAKYGTAAVGITVPGEKTDGETLIIPVTALIADSDGGYAIDVVRGDTVERV